MSGSNSACLDTGSLGEGVESESESEEADEDAPEECEDAPECEDADTEPGSDNLELDTFFDA